MYFSIDKKNPKGFKWDSMMRVYPNTDFGGETYMYGEVSIHERAFFGNELVVHGDRFFAYNKLKVDNDVTVHGEGVVDGDDASRFGFITNTWVKVFNQLSIQDYVLFTGGHDKGVHLHGDTVFGSTLSVGRNVMIGGNQFSCRKDVILGDYASV